MLDLADFALQEQPEHSLMVAISWAWYNGSHTMVTKPIESLEMQIMIQCLINMYTIPIIQNIIKQPKQGHQVHLVFVVCTQRYPLIYIISCVTEKYGKINIVS